MLVNGCARSGLAHQTTYEPPRQLDHHPSRVLPVVGPLAGSGLARSGLEFGWFDGPDGTILLGTQGARLSP